MLNTIKEIIVFANNSHPLFRSVTLCLGGSQLPPLGRNEFNITSYGLTIIAGYFLISRFRVKLPIAYLPNQRFAAIEKAL